MSDYTDDEQESILELLKENVAEIAIIEGAKIGKEVSAQFLLNLVAVVEQYIGKMALDLETFAIHDEREIISMDDVELCARRNMSLFKMISDMAKRINRQRRHVKDEE